MPPPLSPTFGGKYADMRGIVGGARDEWGPFGISCLFCICNGGLVWLVFVKYLGSIKGSFSFPGFIELLERI